MVALRILSYLNQGSKLTDRQEYLSRPEVKINRAKLARAWNRKNQESVLLTKARRRARLAGVPCNISKEDIVIPEFCPILGYKLQVSDGRVSDNSPTLDRIEPQKGYVKDNIAVISHRANRIKTDASLGELKLLVEWLENSVR